MKTTADPNSSDVAKFNNHQPEPGVEALVSYMRKLPRDVPAGTRWLYSTGETNLVGTLVQQATKKPLATYLAEKCGARQAWSSRPPGF
jgi:CubicO group peptidase (beta-lactamase class C family)